MGSRRKNTSLKLSTPDHSSEGTVNVLNHLKELIDPCDFLQTTDAYNSLLDSITRKKEGREFLRNNLGCKSKLPMKSIDQVLVSIENMALNEVPVKPARSTSRTTSRATSRAASMVSHRLSVMKEEEEYETANEIMEEEFDVKPRKSYLDRLVATAMTPKKSRTMTPERPVPTPPIPASNKASTSETEFAPMEQELKPSLSVFHHYQLPTESSSRNATPSKVPPVPPAICKKAPDATKERFKADLAKVTKTLKSKKPVATSHISDNGNGAIEKKKQQLMMKAEKSRKMREEKEKKVRAKKEEAERLAQEKQEQRRIREERAEQFRLEQMKQQDGIRTPPRRPVSSNQSPSRSPSRRLLAQSPSRSPSRRIVAPPPYKTPAKKVFDEEQKPKMTPSPGRIPAKHMRLEGLLGTSKEPTVALSPSRFPSSASSRKLESRQVFVEKDQKPVLCKNSEIEKNEAETRRRHEEQEAFLRHQAKKEQERLLQLENQRREEAAEAAARQLAKEAEEKKRHEIERLAKIRAEEEAKLLEEFDDEPADKENDKKVSYDMTPDRVYKAKSADDYGLDISSGDETDDEEAPRKEVPAWADFSEVRRRAKHQQVCRKEDFRVFFGPIPQPDIALVFGLQQKPRKRGSSAVWNSPMAGHTPKAPLKRNA